MNLDEKYPAIFEKKLDITLRLCSPDVVNEYGRTEGGEKGMGLPVQAKALTHNIRDLVMLSWPPQERKLPDGSKNPAFEYGMTFDDLCRSLGYEILSNVCRLYNDPKGR